MYFRENKTLNSRSRIDGTSSDFSINVDYDHTVKYNKITLLSAVVPKSYYLFKSVSFVLSEDGVQTTINIPDGNYTRKSIIATLTTLLQENSTLSQYLTYNITYDNQTSATEPDTGKFHYTIDGNTEEYPVSFIFDSDEQPASAMGFNSYSTNTFINGYSTLDSTNVISLQLENMLFLTCDGIEDDKNNILCPLVTSTFSTYSYIHFQNVDPYMSAHSFKVGKKILRFAI